MIHNEKENYKNFFKSLKGGCFDDNEIDDSLINATKSKFISKISNIKKESLDYLIFVFTGHGFSRNSGITGIELNESGEIVYENEINSIATRQLNIFDCCRNVIKDQEIRKFSAIANESFLEKSNRDFIKQIFNERIMQARPQNSSLYACSKGESALDTPEGGVFSKNLLDCAKNNIHEGEFKNILDLFNETRTKTIYETTGRQHPDCMIPRFNEKDSLVFSFNPGLNEQQIIL